jgi:hypothetical protein
MIKTYIILTLFDRNFLGISFLCLDSRINKTSFQLYFLQYCCFNFKSFIRLSGFQNYNLAKKVNQKIKGYLIVSKYQQQGQFFNKVIN